LKNSRLSVETLAEMLNVEIEGVKEMVEKLERVKLLFTMLHI